MGIKESFALLWRAQQGRINMAERRGHKAGADKAVIDQLVARAHVAGFGGALVSIVIIILLGGSHGWAGMEG